MHVFRGSAGSLSSGGADADALAVAVDGAEVAGRADRLADRLAVGDQRLVDHRPEPLRDQGHQAALSLLRRARLHPAHAVGDAMDVGVHGDRLLAEGVDQHAVGDLAADARVLHQSLDRPRDPAAARLDHRGGFHDVGGLGAVEADRLQDLLHRAAVGPRERPRRREAPEQRLGDDVGHLVARARGEDGADQRAEGGDAARVPAAQHRERVAARQRLEDPGDGRGHATSPGRDP